MKNFVTVALTGGICSGKNIVSECFEKNGCLVIDTDKVVRDLYKHNKNMNREILTVFGKKILDPNGNVSKQKIAKLVFSDKDALARLNKIVHPKVKEYLSYQADRLKRDNYQGCLIIVAPLLVEAGMAKKYDIVVVVVADEDKRIDRCIERDGLSEKDVKLRIKSQLTDQDRIKYAKYVIDNNNSIEKTNEQVEQVYQEIIQLISK